jgi:hypothetical protein
LRAAIYLTNDGGHRPPLKQKEDSMSIRIFGQHDEATVAQIHRCLPVGGARAVLCADGHKGYLRIGNSIRSRMGAWLGPGHTVGAMPWACARQSSPEGELSWRTTFLPRLLDEVTSISLPQYV